MKARMRIVMEGTDGIMPSQSHSQRIGNLPAVRVPYFPANAIMVTRLDNLSIYFMDESHRRSIIENPKLDQVENYESMNIDYVVETYAAGCFIENIKLGDFSAAQPEG